MSITDIKNKIKIVLIVWMLDIWDAQVVWLLYAFVVIEKEKLMLHVGCAICANNGWLLREI